MSGHILFAILLPFLGTALGAGGVFFLRQNTCPAAHRALTGFAAGIMTAASVWSLLIPAIHQASGWGKLAFVPAAAGVWLGTAGLSLLSRFQRPLWDCPGGTSLMVTAVAIHNLPEGMAVGVVAAAWLAGVGGIGEGEVLALSLGVAIQNLPEGAVVSMPLNKAGMGRWRAFGAGIASGVVEPLGALGALCLAPLAELLLPWMLGFAAGAMLWVVAAELLPEAAEEGSLGAIWFILGFTVMMVLDVSLG